jgi:hypothetical protein
MRLVACDIEMALRNRHASDLMLALEKVVEKEIRWGATAMQHVSARTASWRTVVRTARAAFLKDIACCIPPCFIFEQSHCQSSKTLMPRPKRENQLGIGARNILPAA